MSIIHREREEKKDMPVYHQLQEVPEIQGEEYHEPIDGVRPIDHPIVYAPLFDLRCIKNASGTIYQKEGDNLKICQECFLAAPEDEQDEYLPIFPHSLVHWTSAYSQTLCVTCNETLVKVEHAKFCRECIEEYLYADLQTLQDGWGIPVTIRWHQNEL